MWQCKACEYHNEDLDETCAKCGAELAAQLAGAEAQAEGPDDDASSAVQPETATAESASVETPKPAGNDRLLQVVIAVVILAIIGLAYVAYTRGRLPGIAPAPGQASGGSVNAQADPGATSPFARVEDLGEGVVLPRNQAAKLASFTEALDKAWFALLNKEPLELQPGQLDPESLAELVEISEVGPELITAYQQFEEYISETNDPNINEAAVLMRGQFNDAFTLLISTVSRYRAMDLTATDPAYVLADSVPVAMENYSWIDAEPLRVMWAEARHAARQIELDLQYTEHYRQLSARYDALEQIHNEFNGTLKNIPPTKVRSGVIGKDAQDLLEALDAYATSVEAFALEFEEYCLTLASVEPSDKLERYIAMNRELAQEDHLFCFTECYKMYAKDKKLQHPVYSNLGAHYSFVQQTWPKLALVYETTYRNYEQEWLVFWRPDVLRK